MTRDSRQEPRARVLDTCRAAGPERPAEMRDAKIDPEAPPPLTEATRTVREIILEHDEEVAGSCVEAGMILAWKLRQAAFQPSWRVVRLTVIGIGASGRAHGSSTPPQGSGARSPF